MGRDTEVTPILRPASTRPADRAEVKPTTMEPRDMATAALDAEVDKMKTPDLAVLGQCMATRRSLDNKGDER